MALHSKKDFAELCGIKTNELSVYIKRKKVILSGEYVDDSIQQNKDFLEDRKLKMAMKPGKEVGNTPKAPNVKSPKQSKITDPNIDEPEFNDDEDEEMDTSSGLFKRKLKVEIHKKQEEIKILEVRNAKLNGELIPTDLVKVAFAQFSKLMATEFKNSIDNMLADISKKKDFNRNEVAELRGKMLGFINSSVEKGVTQAKKSIDQIVNEYIVKKEVGERS